MQLKQQTGRIRFSIASELVLTVLTAATLAATIFYPTFAQPPGSTRPGDTEKAAAPESVTDHVHTTVPSLLLLGAAPNRLIVMDGSRLTVRKGDVVLNSDDRFALWNKDSQVEVQQGHIDSIGGFIVNGKGTTTPVPQRVAKAFANPYPNIWISESRYAAAKGTYFNDDKKEAGGEAETAEAIREITLDPGIYPGGIHVRGKSLRLKLNPGVYVMKDGNFFIHEAQVEGTGVTIVLTEGKPPAPNPNFSCGTGARVNLTAPTSGPLKGIALANWARQTDTIHISGDSTQVRLAGTIYSPESGVYVTHKAQATIDRIVCEALHVQAGGQLDITGEGSDIVDP